MLKYKTGGFHTYTENEGCILTETPPNYIWENSRYPVFVEKLQSNECKEKIKLFISITNQGNDHIDNMNNAFTDIITTVAEMSLRKSKPGNQKKEKEIC